MGFYQSLTLLAYLVAYLVAYLIAYIAYLDVVRELLQFGVDQSVSRCLELELLLIIHPLDCCFNGIVDLGGNQIHFFSLTQVSIEYA